MFVYDMPSQMPRDVPMIVAETNQKERNGAWNAPYPAAKGENTAAQPIAVTLVELRDH